MQKSLRAYFFLYSLLVSSALFSQIHYRFPITNYGPKDYGKNQGVQNWALAQTKEGLIYSGSNNGVLEYDGNKWKLLPVINGKWVYSLACDSNNILFAGTEGNFGYFKKNKKGIPEYCSLSDSLLKEEDKFFTRIWRTFAGNDRIYFQSNEALYVYDYKTIKVLYPVSGTSFHLASFANNTLYIRERQKGLMKVVNDKLVFIPNSQLFAEYGLFAALPYKNRDEILLITKEKGLHIYNTKTDEFREFVTPENSVWYTANVIGGIKLKNGNYAINTESYGSIIINSNGEIQNYINSNINLQDDNVVAQLEDCSGNLWLALNKGLSKIEINSATQSFTSIMGSVYSAIQFNEQIYLATSNGLYGKSNLEADFHPEKSFPSSNIIWHLTIKDDLLYLSSNSGIYSFDGKSFSKKCDGNFRKIVFTKNNKILAGGPDGFSILKTNFISEHNFSEEIVGEVLGIEEDPSGNESESVYWVSTNAALYKIIDKTNEPYKIKPYDVSYGLTEDWKYPFLFDNKLVIGNNFGLYELKNESSDSAFFESIDFYKTETSQKSFSYLLDLSDKTIAIVENKPLIVYKNKLHTVFKPFLPIDLGKENALYYYDKKLFICLDEGLVIYNENDSRNYEQSFETVLRKIQTKTDSVLFDGSITGKFELPYKLDYGFNEVNIEVTGNYYSNEDKILFRYKLEGLDTSFSAWQNERKIKFNNLHEGNYRLVVQSKNIFETEGKELLLEFSILPPWYRTTIAYILYLIGFVLFVFIAIKIASARLKKQNKILDDLVKKRTKEIEHKNEELKEQNVQILHQKQEITDSINYAKRIQEAILPPLDQIKSVFENVFIFFQPKDIVSGDFYWFYKINENEFLIASADCTGHGVPGGFMSMVCTDKLNEAVSYSLEPDKILQHVNIRIKESLRQDGKHGSTKDGMEIALLHINKITGKVKYAAANRFLWIIRNGSNEIEDIKPTKAGIGGYTNNDQIFQLHTFQANKGDLFYMSTDGYGDQFGGPEGKKLMTKNFKNFLIGIKDHEIQYQGVLSEEKINAWKGNLEQVDDILVIGLRF